MSILFTIAGVVLLIGFLILLGLGMALAMGVLLVLGVFLGIAYLIFGHGFHWSINGSADNNQVPQQFNQCLLNEENLDLCRSKFTVWEAKDLDLIKQLSKQVKDELGERLEETTQSSNYSSESLNGNATVTMDQETDFAKKKLVHEHYLLVTDPLDDKVKIKELKWDY